MCKNIMISVKQKNEGLIPFQNGYYLGAHIHERFKDYPFGDHLHDKNEWSPYTISRVLPTDDDKEFIPGEGIKTKYYVFLFRTLEKDIIKALRGSIAVDPEIQLKNSVGVINGVKELDVPDFSGSVEFETKSGVIIYDSENKDEILSPKDDNFIREMKEKMRYCYNRYTGEKIDGDLNIMIDDYDKNTVRVSSNGHSVPAFELEGKMNGTEELLKFSFLSGIGASTALGNGCWDVVE